MRLLPKRTCWGLMVAALTILIGSMLVSCDDLATRDDGTVGTGGAGDTSSTEALVVFHDTLGYHHGAAYADQRSPYRPRPRSGCPTGTSKPAA